LPFSNVGFADKQGDTVTVGGMSTKDALADPLASTFASVLTVPLLELYALLWRVGVVEVREVDSSRRAARRYAALVAHDLGAPICPDPAAHDSEHPPRRGCSRAAG